MYTLSQALNYLEAYNLEIGMLYQMDLQISPTKFQYNAGE